MIPSDITMEWVKDRCVEDCDCLVWTCWSDHGDQPRHRFRSDEMDSTRHLRPIVYQYIGQKKQAKGTVVVMTCGNTLCLNPAHMKQITRAEHLRRNNQSVAAKARKSANVTKAIRAQRAKLTMDQARYVRASDKTLSALAGELGVSFQLLSKVRRGEAWPELQASPFAGLMT